MQSFIKLNLLHSGGHKVLVATGSIVKIQERPNGGSFVALTHKDDYGTYCIDVEENVEDVEKLIFHSQVHSIK